MWLTYVMFGPDTFRYLGDMACAVAVLLICVGVMVMFKGKKKEGKEEVVQPVSA